MKPLVVLKTLLKVCFSSVDDSVSGHFRVFVPQHCMHPLFFRLADHACLRGLPLREQVLHKHQPDRLVTSFVNPNGFHCGGARSCECFGRGCNVIGPCPRLGMRLAPRRMSSTFAFGVARLRSCGVGRTWGWASLMAVGVLESAMTIGPVTSFGGLRAKNPSYPPACSLVLRWENACEPLGAVSQACRGSYGLLSKNDNEDASGSAVSYAITGRRIFSGRRSGHVGWTQDCAGWSRGCL